MSSFGLNDPTAPSFWLFAAFAIALLSFAGTGRRYRGVLAGVNLTFIGMVAGVQALSLVMLAITLLHHVCQAGMIRRARIGAVASGSLLLAAFIVHKLQNPPDILSAPKTVFAAIGLSYIFLRGIEYLRASLDGHVSGTSLADTVNYLLPFHMLAAGPVMPYADFKQRPLPTVPFDREQALQAVERIVGGLFKKFVLAGTIETVFLTGFKDDGPYFLLEMQMYYLYIYLDFSAYTDIAVGLGRLLGVATPENFNRPLLARNIIAFWERWHMSLSQFIRRNIFIPIQLMGSRKTKGRHALLVSCSAFGVSFLLCGLWHGINLRFLLWGVGHAAAVIVCNVYRHVLIAKLGRKEAAAFSDHLAVRMVSTVLTFEFVALSLAFQAHPMFAYLD